MNRRRIALCAAVIAVIAGLAIAVPAFAGTNGQQVALYESSNIASACYNGYNQSGNLQNWCGDEPAAIYGVDLLPYYWWKTYNGSPVFLWYYAGTGETNLIGYNTCSVPEYQLGSDWWECNSL